MATRTFRCGSSSAAYYAPPPVRKGPAGSPVPVARADTEPVRLRIRLHLGAARPAAHGFRVIAALADGDTALVCLGATRGEVIAGARAKTATLSPRAVALLLQQWVGRLAAGRWQTLPLRRGELATPRRAPRPRRRADRWPASV
jgi:hypothetical protein